MSKRGMEMAMTSVSRWIQAPFLLVAVAAWLGSPAATAQTLSGMDLVHALRGHAVDIRKRRSREKRPVTIFQRHVHAISGRAR